MILRLISDDKRPVIAQNVRGTLMDGSIFSVLFITEDDSRLAFSLLRDNGIRCWHGGKQAPDGPSIMFQWPQSQKYEIQIIE